MCKVSLAVPSASLEKETGTFQQEKGKDGAEGSLLSPPAGEAAGNGAPGFEGENHSLGVWWRARAMGCPSSTRNAVKLPGTPQHSYSIWRGQKHTFRRHQSPTNVAPLACVFVTYCNIGWNFLYKPVKDDFRRAWLFNISE